MFWRCWLVRSDTFSKFFLSAKSHPSSTCYVTDVSLRLLSSGAHSDPGDRLWGPRGLAPRQSFPELPLQDPQGRGLPVHPERDHKAADEPTDTNISPGITEKGRVAHVCRTSMMFFELVGVQEYYFSTQDNPLVQWICVTKSNTCGFWTFWTSQLTNFKTHL